MKNFLFLLYLLFLLIGCSNQVYKSIWNTEKNKQPFSIFDNKNNISISCANDSTTLYLELYTTEINTIEKIGKLGLSLWLSEGSIPRHKYGIHYPIPTKEFSLNNLQKQQTEPFDTIALEMSEGETPTILNVGELNDIEVSATISNDSFHYKMKIPLALLNISMAEEQKITISIVSTKEEIPNYDSSMESSEIIRRKLDNYKAKPIYHNATNELFPSFYTVLLSRYAK